MNDKMVEEIIEILKNKISHQKYKKINPISLGFTDNEIESHTEENIDNFCKNINYKYPARMGGGFIPIYYELDKIIKTINEILRVINDKK